MLYIENANLVLEHGILWDGAILVEGDRIRALGRRSELSPPSGAEIVDAEGRYVGPGFVDLHVHGGGGSLFAFDPEGAARHFLRHGETTVLATLYYDLSKQEFLDAILGVRQLMQEGKCENIAGFYMEGPYMNPKYGASAEKNQWRGTIRPEDYQEIVDLAGDLARVWAIAPERVGIEKFMAYARQVNPKTVFSMGHSEASQEEIDRCREQFGLRLQTHCMNATGRIETWKGVRGSGPDEACLLDREMYAELICDSKGIHVNPTLIRLVLQNKGLDRTVLITDSFVSAEPGPDHLDCPGDLQFDANGNLSGSKLTMETACRNLMTHTNCGIAQAFLLAARNPAKAIGLDKEIGTLAAGKRADLVMVDDRFNVHAVIVKGRLWRE